MKIYIDVGTKKNDNISQEFLTYIKTNRIIDGMNESEDKQEDIEHIITDFDIVMTSDENLIEKIARRNKNIVIKIDRDLNIDVLKYIKSNPKSFRIGKVNSLKVICKLEKV